MSGFLVKTNISFPEDPEVQRVFLQKTLMSHAYAINQRDTGQYDSEEFPTGQQWKLEPTQIPFRKIIPLSIDSAAAPNTNTFAHGLDPTEYIFTKIEAVIGNQSNLWIPLPYPGADQTLLYVSASDIVIENSTNSFDGFTGYCVIEYIKI